MHTNTFACPECGRRMGVGSDQTGRPVRCPHCHKVVVSPTPRPEPAAPPPRVPEFDAGPRERAESILAEQGEEDDAVFASAPVSVHRVEMPALSDEVTERGSDGEGESKPDPSPSVPRLPSSDPWTKLDEPVPAEEPAAPPPLPTPVDPTVRRLQIALAAVAVYALLATAVGAWGWLRGAAQPAPTPARGR